LFLKIFATGYQIFHSHSKCSIAKYIRGGNDRIEENVESCDQRQHLAVESKICFKNREHYKNASSWNGRNRKFCQNKVGGEYQICENSQLYKEKRRENAKLRCEAAPDEEMLYSIVFIT